MSFENTFCSGPWFHMRIENNGDYNYCRYSDLKVGNSQNNIRHQSIDFYFQNELANTRLKLLQAQNILGCRHCNKMEEHGKTSGRERQLLKAGIQSNNFNKTFLSSPWKQSFHQSYQNKGITDQMPQDWQIDLGNYCNNACMFCFPHFSSKLANDFLKLGFIDKLPDQNWTSDPVLFKKFITNLQQTSSKLSYLHFIGGETLITPAFKVILEKLLEYGLNENLTIGFTTNLSVWRQDIFDLLTNFKVNLGLSLECLHPVNEYIRYGSNYSDTVFLLNKWIDLGKQQDWYITIRTTPTLLSVLHLDTVYDFSLQKNVFVESCNFLDRPEFLRMSVLPKQYRKIALEKINHVLNNFKVTEKRILNIKNKQSMQTQILEDLTSYRNYLENEQFEEHRLPDTVNYIKKLESIRNNRVLDYLPEYEQLFRSAGY